MKRKLIIATVVVAVGALVVVALQLRAHSAQPAPAPAAATANAPSVAKPEDAPPEPPAAPTPTPPGQAVIVHARLSDGKVGTAAEVAHLQELELRLQAAIDHASAGELDGNDIGDGEYTIFAYGPDADALFRTVEPLLRAAKLNKGSYTIKRYGPDEDENAKETQIDL